MSDWGFSSAEGCCTIELSLEENTTGGIHMASKVGKLIKEARQAADLTQEKLARKVGGGLTASDISKQEYETFMQTTPCQECQGRRLKPEALAVTVGDKNIAELTELPIRELADFMSDLKLTPMQLQIGSLILKEIRARLGFLVDVGLEYLTLSRATGSLSGGEAQRIKLSLELSRRTNGQALYILDEPTTGLHWDDVDKLLKLLFKLRDAGNTIIVIEHHPDFIRLADYLIELGPTGGEKGGYLLTKQ